MQEDQNKKLFNSKEAQSLPLNTVPKRNTYRYISKHHAQFLESDLRDQVVKRRDVVRWNFIGNLDENMKLKRLVNMMKKMKRIKDFLLVTIPERTTTYKHFAELGEAIKRQRGLEKIFLELMFTINRFVNEKQVSELAQGIQRVCRLKDIHISIDQNEFADEGFNVLSESFKRLCALKRLSVEFKNTDEITDKGLEEFGRKLKKVDSLRHITIKSGSAKITNQGVQMLGQNLKRIKLLEDIRLGLGWQEMKGLEKLSEVLKEIRQLKRTTIDFSIPQYLYRGDDRITEHLSPGLQEFKFFQNLALKRLSLSGITDDGLRLFCEALEKFEFLRELDLALYCGSLSTFNGVQITKKGIQSLSETFKKLVHLKALNFTILQCDRLTDNEMSLLSQGLKELKSLETITFSIKTASVVTDQGLKMLAQALKQMKSLKTLHIEIYRSSQIENEGINLLTRDFKELGMLKDVTLKLGECSLITNEVLKIVNKNVTQISSLRYVCLYFMDCDQIGLKETLELGESLKKKFMCKVRHSSDSVGTWAYP